MKKSKSPSASAKPGRPSKRTVGRPPAKAADQEGSEMKEKILQTFCEICRHEGIEAVTLQKVADKSGVALTTVRYHFQMKGLSLSQVAQAYVSDKTYQHIDNGMLKARTQASYNPVQAYIGVMFDWIEEQPVQASFLIYYYYVSSTEVPVEIGNQELVEIAQRRILALVYEGLGMKIYKFEGDPSEASVHIHTLVMGACLIAATSRNSEFSRLQRQRCQKWAAEILKAV